MVFSRSISLMEGTNIIRRSIHLFLKHYQFFTTVASLLFFPASGSILISLFLPPSRLVPRLSSQIGTLFAGAGLTSTKFTTFLNLKISQTITSFFISLPFTLSFLLLAKACVIIHVRVHEISRKPPSSRWLLGSLGPVWKRLFNTYLITIGVIISANATIFSFIFLAFNSLDILGVSSSASPAVLSSVAAAFYSIVLANTILTCNLAVIVAGMENCCGIVAIVRAWVLLKGRAATALSLLLPVNVCFAAIESLFYYRVMKNYKLSNVWEGALLVYMYSIVSLVDTIMVCLFYNNSIMLRCHSSSKCSEEENKDEEDEVEEEQGRTYHSVSASIP